ncbi:hypothetical protein MTBBW1_2640001 [Desulfamplus magnetovallimortis]|uniref:Uncharacterized protein n=1 Tax=Desulfamplus magnetovallimortis TaxID=1246637 RepID=A0A1W1HF81_9BACT|nr:hypothetical protein MTBBW1_2640001 [Desulfamplus magnetovallimortis]
MKAYTMLAKLETLGVMASFSRPRVSNDNPYSESTGCYGMSNAFNLTTIYSMFKFLILDFLKLLNDRRFDKLLTNF